MLLAQCQVTLQLGSTSPPGTPLGGHLSKESPVWVGSEAGAEEGAPDPTVFSLPRLPCLSGSSSSIPAFSSIPASAHSQQSWKGTCPHTHSHLASLLTKKKKKSHVISSHSSRRNVSLEEKTDGVGMW